MDDPKDLISVYEAANATEAYLVKNLLEDEDIPAFVSEENEPLAGLPITAPDVLVAKADEPRARAVVAAYEEQQIVRAERPDWVCPNCGAKVIGALDECDNCGAPRPGTEEAEDQASDEPEEL